MFTNWLTSPSSMAAFSSSVVSSPPDVILEVGPAPGGARFVAHGALLAMHSGYLRSAVRMDENGMHSSDMPIYLANVTAEQFGPLLTYMYTGFLDLNIENIFGVLLATHVLHMPRALEICRAFLSRSQSEGYLNSTFLAQLGDGVKGSSSGSAGGSGGSAENSGKYSSPGSVKVIRPIASKPSIPNLGFIVPPMPHISLPSTGTPFRSLERTQSHGSTAISDGIPADSHQNRNSLSPTTISLQRSKSNSSPKEGSLQKSSKPKRLSTVEKPKRLVELQPVQQTSKKDTCIDSENNKIIIDVASCDGPVRFRRVLNDAYGRQPQAADLVNLQSQERTHQSVSNSFHQQMARTISQQRQQQHSDESENSEDLKQMGHQSGGSGSNSGEVYNCVYCKHTFKSQYCYQKHAKRHLNPLSLDSVEQPALSGSVGNGNVAPIAVASISDKDEKLSNHSLELKREVRPLDMNVQYYPCKTCGSKFPSYYFVHKHRKMCHANEDAGSQ